jgi:hypothetical protein
MSRGVPLNRSLPLQADAEPGFASAIDGFIGPQAKHLDRQPIIQNVR